MPLCSPCSSALLLCPGRSWRAVPLWPAQFLSPLAATLGLVYTSKGTHRHCQSPHKGESFPSLGLVLWAGTGWLKCWEEPVFLHKKLSEYVPLTSWVPRCRSFLIPSVNPAAVTYQQRVLLLTFYLTEAQVSQGRFLSSKPPVCPQSLLKSPQ